jgi:hypothetical protein
MSFRAERISAKSSVSLKFRGAFQRSLMALVVFRGKQALRTLIEVIFVYEKISRIYSRLIYDYGTAKSTRIPFEEYINTTIKAYITSQGEKCDWGASVKNNTAADP